MKMRKCMSAIFMVESQGNALYLRLQNFIVTKATANFSLAKRLKVTEDLNFTNCLCKGMPGDYICDSCVIGQKRAKNVGTKICFGDKMCFVGRSK